MVNYPKLSTPLPEKKKGTPLWQWLLHPFIVLSASGFRALDSSTFHSNVSSFLFPAGPDGLENKKFTDALKPYTVGLIPSTPLPLFRPHNFLREIFEREAMQVRTRKILRKWNHGGPQIFLVLCYLGGTNDSIWNPKGFALKMTHSGYNGEQRNSRIFNLLIEPKQGISISLEELVQIS